MEKQIANYSYNQKDFLGKGSYSNVYKCKDMLTQETLAIKIIEKRLMQSQMNAELILGEIEVMKHLNHPNIVQMMDVYQTPNNFYLILEFCNQGDLEQLIKKGMLDEEQAQLIFSQMVLGYDYLFQQNLMHRDLKPANIFFSNNITKIADFGFVKKYETNQPIKTKQAGSPIYTSPQILMGHYYTYLCDMFSFGIILYEILHGTNPYVSCFNLDFRSDKRTSYWIDELKILKVPSKVIQISSLSEQVKDLIQRLTTFEEKDRMNFEDLKNHPFLRNQLNLFQEKVNQQILQQIPQPIPQQIPKQIPQPIPQPIPQQIAMTIQAVKQEKMNNPSPLSEQPKIGYNLPDLLNIIIEIFEGINQLFNNINIEILSYTLNKLIVYTAQQSLEPQIQRLVISAQKNLQNFQNNLENQLNLQNILLSEGEQIQEYRSEFLVFAIKQIQQNIRRLNHDISQKNNMEDNFQLKVHIIQNLVILKSMLSHEKSPLNQNSVIEIEKNNIKDICNLRTQVFKEFK